MTRWNDVYAKREDVYGPTANGLVWQYVQAAPPGQVLDLGCGEGRNGLMASALGRETLGLDLSAVAVDRANARARQLQVPFRAEVSDLSAYQYPPEHFAFVIAAFTLPFFPKGEVAHQLRQMHRALVRGGMLYASALTTDDPDYRAHTGQYEERERGSFFKPELGEFRTFFGPHELRTMAEAAGFTVVEYLEGTFLDEHPTPHYHAQAQLVARS